MAVLSGGNRLTAAAECRRRLPIASWREQFRGSDMTAHAADHVLGQTRACRLSLDSDGKRQHRAKIGQPLSCRPVPSAPTCPAYLVGAHGDEGPASGQPGTDGVGRFLLAATAGASGKHQAWPVPEDVLLVVRRRWGCRRLPESHHAMSKGATSAVDRGVDWMPGNFQHAQCGLCARGWHRCSSRACRTGAYL